MANDLDTTLAEQHKWVVSDGREGALANLSGSDLRSIDLQGRDLRMVSFFEASARYADFRGANLQCANLLGIDMEHALLDGANMGGANLTGARLRGATLRGVNLDNANIRHIDVEGAEGIVTVGPVGSSRRTIYAVDHYDRWMVHAGCWWGTVDDLEERVAPGGNHGWDDDDEDQWRAEYTAAIAFIRAMTEDRASCPVGVTEIAARLGVHHDTVQKWRRRGLGFPAPEWTVGGRPAWNWPTVQAWAQSTGRTT